MHSENQKPRKMYLCMFTYESAHLRNCPGKSQKIDFSPENPMELWPFWYHSHGFTKLYKLSYVDSRSIHWSRKSLNSRNST